MCKFAKRKFKHTSSDVRSVRMKYPIIEKKRSSIKFPPSEL